MKGRVTSILQLSVRELEAWRDLASHAVQPNPLFEAGSLLPTARHLPSGAAMALVIAEEDGVFFACFPVMKAAAHTRPSTTWSGVSQSVYTSQVRRLDYDGTPLFRRERGVEAAKCLLSAVSQGRGKDSPHILVLEAMDLDGPVRGFLREAAKQRRTPWHTYREWERPVVMRRAQKDYRTVHKAEHLRNFEKKSQRLAKLLGGDVTVVDRSADAAAIGTLLEIEDSGYKAAQRISLASHFGEIEWFHEMCAHFRDIDRLYVFSLEVNDEVVAMMALIEGDDVLFGLQTVFREEYAKSSPGVLLWLEVVDLFHTGTSALLLDSCTYPHNVTLLNLMPDRRQVSTELFHVGARRGRLRFRLYAAGQTLLGLNSPFRQRHERLCTFLDRHLSRFGVIGS